MDIIVPEASGDAGLGFLETYVATGLAKATRLFLCQLSATEVSGELFKDAFQEVHVLAFPKLTDYNLSSASEFLVKQIDHFKICNGFVAPTAEELTPLFIVPSVQRLLKDSKIDTSLLPSSLAYRVSRDKLLLSHIFPVEVALTHECHFLDNGTPVFAKPRIGSGSKGCQIVFTKEEALHLKGYIFQPILSGNDYVVDLIDNFALAREVFRQKGGSDVDFQYIFDEELLTISRAIKDSLGCRVLNVQFRRDITGKFKVIDIGTRFSGAAFCMYLPQQFNVLIYYLHPEKYDGKIPFVENKRVMRFLDMVSI